MKKLLGLFFALAFATSAWAVSPTTRVGNAAYTITPTDVRVVTTTAFTAGRTWTLPAAASSCVGQTCQPYAFQLEINDVAGAISQASPLTIARATGDTINGNAANLVISGSKARVLLIPTTGSNWQAQVLGDYVTSGLCPPPATTATVTITIAAPGVISWADHGMTGACPVVFTTTDTLPTGIVSGTTYWVVPSSIATGSFQIATTVANALAGTAITTSSTQAGVQTGTAGSPLTSTTAANITGLTLSQGEWDCRGKISRTLASNTSITVLKGSIFGTSATSGTQGGVGVSWAQTAANVVGVLGQDSTIGPERVVLTANTNRFLVAQDTFSVSTNVAYGTMFCRRVH